MKDLVPTISVIIPTFNRAKMIVPCIKSVLAQSYPVNEIIIIDDGSTDDTLSVLNNSKYEINLLQTSNNCGAQTARNIGIKAAKSNWITFLDSDDEWQPNKIKKQISALKTADFNPLTVVHGDCFVKNLDSDDRTYWKLDRIDGENVYKQLLAKSSTFFPAILTSKIALEKINFLDENVPSYHEWDTAIRLSKFCRFIHIQEPLFTYNIHKNTISKNVELSIKGYNYIINKYQSEIKKFCGEKVFTDHLLNNSKFALNNDKSSIGRIILKQISNKYIKKNIFLLFSYIKIKPIYFTKFKQLFKWKK